MRKYIVEGVDQITPSTLLLTLKRAESGAPFAFQPGQYAAISFYRRHRPSVVRCFSIVSSPTQQGLLQFAMRTKGRYTRALTGLLPGDKVTVRGPYGGFIFDQKRDQRTVFLAGGIGITPFMSMIRYAADLKADNQIDLLYSCASQDDIPFLNELKSLTKLNPRFSVTFVVSSGPVDKLHGVRVVQGRIAPEIIDHVVPPSLIPGTTFLICGPPPFMKGMFGVLQSKGVQKSYIMTEAFSQGPNRQTGKVKNWPLNMYALSAVGLATSSGVVVVADILRTLPPSSIFGTESNLTKAELTNSRQDDLDALVNSLPEQTTASTMSDALVQALAAAEAAQAAAQPATAVIKSQPQKITNNTAPVVASPTPSPSPTPTPAPAPTPPPPACTTTQSGVTTC